MKANELYLMHVTRLENMITCMNLLVSYMDQTSRKMLIDEDSALLTTMVKNECELVMEIAERVRWIASALTHQW